MNTAELVAILMRSNETIAKREMMLPMSEAKRKRQKGVTTVEYAVSSFSSQSPLWLPIPTYRALLSTSFQTFRADLGRSFEFKAVRSREIQRKDRHERNDTTDLVKRERTRSEMEGAPVTDVHEP